jgi:hypothetical protein
MNIYIESMGKNDNPLLIRLALTNRRRDKHRRPPCLRLGGSLGGGKRGGDHRLGPPEMGFNRVDRDVQDFRDVLVRPVFSENEFFGYFEGDGNKALKRL